MGRNKEKEEIDEFFDLKKSDKKALVLYNDDHHFFEFVINCKLLVKYAVLFIYSLFFALIYNLSIYLSSTDF